MSPRSEFISGVRALLPFLLGTMPSGLIVGAACVGAGIPPGYTLAMSVIIFAGSAQLAAAQLVSVHASAIIVIFTTLVLSVRLIIYSLTLAPHFQHLPLRWKIPLAYLTTDSAYAACFARLNQNSDTQAHLHWHFLGAGVALWLGWQISIAAGIFIGLRLPPQWALDFVNPLALLAMIVPAISDAATARAAWAAVVLAVMAFALPYRLGLLVAALGGTAFGAWKGWRR